MQWKIINMEDQRQKDIIEAAWLITYTSAQFEEVGIDMGYKDEDLDNFIWEVYQYLLTND